MFPNLKLSLALVLVTGFDVDIQQAGGVSEFIHNIFVSILKHQGGLMTEDLNLNNGHYRQ